MLDKGGHYPPLKVAQEINSVVRGWLNYYDVPGVSYAAMSKSEVKTVYARKTETLLQPQEPKTQSLVWSTSL